MSKWKYLLLGAALMEFAIGFSNARPNAFFYPGLPLWAMLFILFLLCRIFEKESALYDEQHREESLARQAAPSTSPAFLSHPMGNTNPALNTSRSP
jgi:hypothetical protein